MAITYEDVFDTQNGYDYANQAWVVNGKYEPCGHPTECDCYGKLHAGESIAANAVVH